MQLFKLLATLGAAVLLGGRRSMDRYHRPANQRESADWSSAAATTYAAIVAVRNTELQVHWARYNIQSALNVGFVAAVLTVATRESTLSAENRLAIGLCGLLLAIFWIIFAAQSKRILTKRWDRHIRDLETSLGSKLPYDLFLKVTAEDQTLFGPLTILQLLLPATFVFGWIVFIVWPLCRSVLPSGWS